MIKAKKAKGALRVVFGAVKLGNPTAKAPEYSVFILGAAGAGVFCAKKRAWRFCKSTFLSVWYTFSINERYLAGVSSIIPLAYYKKREILRQHP